MNRTEQIILGGLALLTLSTGLEARHLDQPSAEDRLQALLLANADLLGQGLGERTQTAQCEVRGPLPDPACSPGAIFADATPAEICVSGYTKTVRDVSTSLKRQIYTEYGLAYPQARGTYEADHLIPLELGGNNDIANLFPEAAEPRPGFHEKDLVENYLHAEVCAGRVELALAQVQIARDWLAVYRALTPEQVQQLEQQFRSFGN